MEQVCLIFNTRIEEAYDSLTNMEKDIAEFMVKNPLDVINGTAESISSAVGCSPATIVRFSRSCGYSGLTDLKLNLKREYDTLNSPSKGMGIKQDDTVASVKKKILGYHSMIINAMMSSWNETAYSYAEDAMIDADHILIIAEGGSRATAICLMDICLQLGLPCEMAVDPVYEAMKIGIMDKDCVVIALSYSGRMQDILDSLKLAKSRGITTIGLLGTMGSPMQDYTDILLNTNMIDSSFFMSSLSFRISEMAVIEVLSTLLTLRLGKGLEALPIENEFVSLRRVKDHENESIKQKQEEQRK